MGKKKPKPTRQNSPLQTGWRAPGMARRIADKLFRPQSERVGEIHFHQPEVVKCRDGVFQQTEKVEP
ncbi:MAG: hypothetical protein HQK82_14310 [Desulfovibrionaceae bacterium]|nr:hypothetical protein [Desulfovibrionaceae bacterium]